MNIFRDYSGFCGKIRIESLNKSLAEFFSLSKEIRCRLDKKAYLLDEYVITVLQGINAVNAFSTIDDCFDSTCEWHRQINERTEYPPSKFQEKTTCDNLHVIEFTNDFFVNAIEEHKKKCCDRISEEVDIFYIRQLYDEICKRLDRETEMEQLNFIIQKKFLITSSMSIFAQGLSENLMHSLTYRDIETNKPIFVLAYHRSMVLHRNIRLSILSRLSYIPSHAKLRLCS